MENQDLPLKRLFATQLLVADVPKKEETTVGGLIIPSTDDDKSAVAVKVVMVSQKVAQATDDTEKVEVGETVLVSRYAGTPLAYKGKDYRLLRITDLLGVTHDTSD